MQYHDLPHYLHVQFADAARVYAALCDAAKVRKSISGSLYWRRFNGIEYLLQTSASGRQKRLAPRSAETEQRYAGFIADRQRAREQLRQLIVAMGQQRRVNKVLRVGHIPNAWIKVMNGIRDAGLADEVSVIGTAATYAYESAAGVRIIGDSNNAGEAAVLTDRRKRLQLAVPGAAQAIHLMTVIEHVAPAFNIYKGQRYVAVDRHGLEIEVLFDGCKASPGSMAAAEERRHLVTLLDAPRFVQTVVGANGEMAEMATIAPRNFVLHKLALANHPGRDTLERYRDAALAKVVLAIVHERLEASRPRFNAPLGNFGLAPAADWAGAALVARGWPGI